MSIQDASSGEPNFRDWILVLSRGWKFLALTTLVGTAFGLFQSRWQQSIYQSDALVQIETDESQFSSSQTGEFQDLFGSVSKTETEVEILRSRMVLMPVADSLRLDLVSSPVSAWDRLLGRQGRIDLLELDLPSPSPTARQSAWLLVGRTDTTMALVSPEGDSVCLVPVGELLSVPYKDDTIRIQIGSMNARPGEQFALGTISRMSATRRLQGSLQVKEKGKKTSILLLTYRDDYPDRAAKILNEITRSYMRQNIDAKSAEAGKTLGFLKQQLPKVKAKLDSTDSALNAFRRAKGTIDLTAEAKVSLEQQVDLGKDLLELEQRKQDLSRLYEENHPQIKAINSQIGRIRAAMSKSSGKAKSLPETQQEVLKLTRDVTVATEFYQAMLDKVQQFEVIRAGEVGSARILDTAQISRAPVAPDRNRTLLLGILAGFVGGSLLLMLRSVLDKGLRDASQIEKCAGASIIAQIPDSRGEKRFDKPGKRSFLAVESPNDLAIESLRSLRTAIEFTVLGQDKKILAISGLTPGVGKSFVSANLALLFASSNRKVLLVDGDLRKGVLHHFFRSERTPGFSDLLLGNTKFESIVQRHPTQPNLEFVPTGTLLAYPSELLSTKGVQEVIGRWKEAYDLIIIDTAPVLLVTDPSLIFRFTDHVALVLEQGRHDPSEIREAVRRSKVSESTSIGLILNKCELNPIAYRRMGKYGAAKEA